MGKGNMKLLVVVALIAILAGSWYTLFNDAAALQRQYDDYLRIAQEKRDGDLWDDALDAYKAALQMNDTLALREEICDYYETINRNDAYLAFCEETVTKYPHDARAYERMADYYSSTENYTACYNILNRASKRGVSSDGLTEIMADVRYQFEYIGYGYPQVGIFSNNLCAVQRSDGKWAYVGTDGKTRLGFRYLDAGEYTGQYLPVQLDTEEYVLIDLSGREKSKDTSGLKIEDCGYLFEDKMAVKYDGKYHYCDAQFQTLFGSYDYAGTFNGGLAAVREGDAWYIIDAAGNKVTGAYEEIKVDEKGVSYRNGVAFVKDGGRYYLIDTAGKRVGDTSWADVDCFNSAQPAAVSNGEKWGYTDASGNMVLDYTYEEAKSFMYGFAAVAKDGKWGYIILDDYSLQIDYQFTAAMDFGPAGSAFVDNGRGWDLIRLYANR
ncbi:MAG: WG repeat-containing protein [Clostridia bacterium]|nr:WG repeat-containing protein [Clostridia bacterium]